MEQESESSFMASSSSSLPITTALTSTTEELFRIWQGNCLQLQQQNNNDTSKIPKRVTAIQLEARNFFESIVQRTTVQVGETVVLQTRASHSDALALLIQSLQPCFAATATLATRWAALNCFTGSLQGCQRQHAIMSLPVIKLIGTFLLQHAGPIASNNDGDDESTGDYDEQIRDTAVVGLTSLVQCTANIISSTAQGNDDGDSLEWLKLRLTITKSGVERRCAQLLDDDDDDVDKKDDYYGYQRPATASGLSLLPRSRRSLCFDLIRAAVDAVASTTDLQKQQKHPELYADQQLDATTRLELTDFCKFVIACLHGESDPRCLWQLLRLFDAVLTAFQQLLAQHFPVSELFDAVAPYYPIQFNPPPNDAHGITRASLRQAVLKVLSCTFYDHDRHDDDSMATLSCGLILETLIPPPEDGPPTPKEQFEALEDLQTFLFATQGGINTETNCDKLDIDDIKLISDALLVVHETSSLAVSRGDDVVHAKALADLCRTMVAQVAVATERRPNKNAWQVFVEGPVRQLAVRLDSSASGRVAIAYMACLASSGGAKTLRVCLDAGLVPLLKRLEDAASEDDGTTAVYGIGAFFSSCRAATDRSSHDGIHLHPHPLQPYSTVAFDRMFEILRPTEKGNKATAPAIQIAAVRALESILLASPAELFVDGRIDRIVSALRWISFLSRGTTKNDANESGDEAELTAASSLTLGSFLGRALDMRTGYVSMSVSNATPSSTVLEAEQIRGFLQDDFFATLLASAKIQSKSESTPTKHDHKTLALAASFSLNAASQVVQPLVESLHKALLTGHDDTAKAVAEALSFLFKQDDQLASRAYQELSSPAVTALDIMASLAPRAHVDGKGMEADFGMSILRLPQTIEDRERCNLVLEKAYEIIRLLRKGYEVGVTGEHFEKLVTTVDQFLPPLCDTDTIKLSIALPFLSAAMASSTPKPSAVIASGKSTCETLRAMVGDLADFAMAPEHFPASRTHAAQCLHAAISLFTPRNAQECPARDLTKQKIMPSLKSSIDASRRIQQSSKARDAAVASVLDNLSVLALLGSAAACRGGPSTKTSDQIVLCLVDLACTKKSDFLFTDDVENDIDLTVFDTRDHKESTKISIGAASAFGSILATECGHLLWKQRLTHISVKRILECIDKTANPGSDSKQHDSLGLLSAVCHVICSSNLQNVTATNLEAIAGVIAYGLSPAALQVATRVDTSVTELVLAALVKLLCVSPSSFRNNIHPLVTGTMRAYATAGDMERRSEVACKLLALQSLAAIAHMNNSLEILKSVKPAVVSLLGAATNHPSSLLRLAAVEVRNAWYVVE
jgi:Dos2-interacting transcription regulator of RNA-Pol-II